MTRPIHQAKGGARQRSPKSHLGNAAPAYPVPANSCKGRFIVDGVSLVLSGHQAFVMRTLIEARASGRGVTHDELRNVSLNAPDVVMRLRAKGVGISTRRGKPSRWHLVSHAREGRPA